MNANEVDVTGIFERKPDYVFAWKVPTLGVKAEADVPSWLVDLMSEGSVFVNTHGGLSYSDVWGQRGCAPGDFIILTKDAEVDFCPAQRFTDQYAQSGQLTN